MPASGILLGIDLHPDCCNLDLPGQSEPLLTTRPGVPDQQVMRREPPHKLCVFNQMAKAAGQKLKVFQAQFGFFETIIATPSQAAALRAWGTHQNLFATGEAKLCADEGAVAAALQHPETSLRRPVGSNESFALQPTSLPKVPEAKKSRPKSAAKTQQVSSPVPDRSQLNAADSALRDLDESRKKEEADFHREAEALGAKRADAQAAYVSKRKQASAAVKAAREAYRKAGGTV